MGPLEAFLLDCARGPGLGTQEVSGSNPDSMAYQLQGRSSFFNLRLSLFPLDENNILTSV